MIDSLQLTAKYKVATPADWKAGEDVIIVPAVSDEEAKERFGDFKTIKPYLRTVQPTADAEGYARPALGRRLGRRASGQT